MPGSATPWWRDAVMYQVYLAGVRARLPYLRDLGVDGLWLTDDMDARGLLDDAQAIGLRVRFRTALVDDLDVLTCQLDADQLRTSIEDTLEAFASGRAPVTWMLSNHDDTRRARAMLLLMLALPGSVLLYQGEELGLSQPTGWQDNTAEVQARQPDSMLAFYRAALAARRTLSANTAGTVTWLDGPEGVLAFHRGSFGCTVNLSGQLVPVIGPVLLSSAAIVDGLLPSDAAVWTSGLPGVDQAAQHALHEGR
jgi:glycosidase